LVSFPSTKQRHSQKQKGKGGKKWKTAATRFGRVPRDRRGARRACGDRDFRFTPFSGRKVKVGRY
jgi:hypothetical protein